MIKRLYFLVYFTTNVRLKLEEIVAGLTDELPVLVLVFTFCIDITDYNISSPHYQNGVGVGVGVGLNRI